MTVGPTNAFNALGIITPKTLNRLMMLTLNGDSIVNPLGEALDRDERTPQGRARKEREGHRRYFETAMAQLEERRIEFLRDLDRREQACIEALHENEEQLREARKELQMIRDRAYEITLPDGSTTKVYRDGDKVRTEAGAEVGRDVLKPEDVPNGMPEWSEFTSANEHYKARCDEHKKILEYRQKLEHTRDAAGRDDLSPETLDKLKTGIEQMPDAVRAHYSGSEAAQPSRGEGADNSFERRASSMKAFSAAAAEHSGIPTDDGDPGLKKRPQADASMPAPK